MGHVSLATTNIYAEVDLEMKAKALANCEGEKEEAKKPWREDKGLMQFLRSMSLILLCGVQPPANRALYPCGMGWTPHNRLNHINTCYVVHHITVSVTSSSVTDRCAMKVTPFDT